MNQNMVLIAIMHSTPHVLDVEENLFKSCTGIWGHYILLENGYLLPTSVCDNSLWKLPGSAVLLEFVMIGLANTVDTVPPQTDHTVEMMIAVNVGILCRQSFFMSWIPQ